jgi:hypothetical protein
MPTFETPDPISVTLELGAGNISIVASERADTLVEVRPSDPDSDSDRVMADRTRVEYDGGKLLIQTPRASRQHISGMLLIRTKTPRGQRRILLGGGGSVDYYAVRSATATSVFSTTSTRRHHGKSSSFCHYRAVLGAKGWWAWKHTHQSLPDPTPSLGRENTAHLGHSSTMPWHI